MSGDEGSLDLPGCGYKVGLALLGASDWFQSSHINTVFSSAVTPGTECVIGPFWAGPHIIKLPEGFNKSGSNTELNSSYLSPGPLKYPELS